jgi:exo-beta-1,3-glucanase (GH17 family)
MHPSRLIVLVLALAATLAVWWWPNRWQAGDVAMPPGLINSVSFAAYGPDESPLTETFPTKAEVMDRLNRLKPLARGIRTYSALEGDYDIAELAGQAGLKLWLGIWLSPDPARNAAEIARAVQLAHDHPAVIDRVIVGNEVLLRRDLPEAALIAAIDTVRAQVAQPVTYADVWEFWEKHPAVARHVDIVTVHMLPYWEDDPTGIDGAVAHVRDVFGHMQALFPGQRIAIGETGWPSAGRARRNAVPSIVNEAVFLRRFIALAQEKSFDYNIIEAYDQDWKSISEGTVGARWGLLSDRGRVKFPLHGPVSDNPGWFWDAALALLAGGVLALLSGRRSAGGLTAAILLGNALVFAWAGTVPVAFSLGLGIAAAFNMLGQAMLAWLVLRDPLARGAPRTGAETTRAVRDLLRPRLPPRGAWLADLSFIFLWACAVLQVLLVVDPRYRDFPLPVFAVPLAATLLRALQGRLPRGGGGREEGLLLAMLAGGALASAIIEGATNPQSLMWNAAVLVLAAPLAWRLMPASRVLVAA